MSEYLIEINDEDVGHEPVNGVEYRLRETAKIVAFNQEGKIALLYVGKDNYHKLPGGGIDEGESLEEAALREILEEVGANIKVREGFVEKTLEYRGKKELKQISYCIISDVIGDIGEPDFTEEEIALGLQVKWVSLDEAIELIDADITDYYGGPFVRARDLAFLEAVKDKLGGKL